MAVATIITIHDVYSIAARNAHSLGAPITLRCAAPQGDTEITIFLRDRDTVERLVAAINKAAEHAQKSAPVPPDEDRAYKAAAMHYFATGSIKR
jgi:hypothetical protein